jgi:hypothetical protein
VQGVSCCFKEKLDSLAKKWLVAKCLRGYKYDLFIKKTKTQSTICCPYWRLFVSVYDIDTYDVVSFLFDLEVLENEDEYEVEVHDFVGEPKKWALIPGMDIFCFCFFCSFKIKYVSS